MKRVYLDYLVKGYCYCSGDYRIILKFVGFDIDYIDIKVTKWTIVIDEIGLTSTNGFVYLGLSCDNWFELGFRFGR